MAAGAALLRLLYWVPALCPDCLDYGGAAFLALLCFAGIGIAWLVLCVGTVLGLDVWVGLGAAGRSAVRRADAAALAVGVAGVVAGLGALTLWLRQ